MIIKWLGHSAFQITTNEYLKILIDPFISNNPAAPVKVEELRADLILVTHGHQDHFGDTMEIADRTGAVIIANHVLIPSTSKSRNINLARTAPALWTNT